MPSPEVEFTDDFTSFDKGPFPIPFNDEIDEDDALTPEDLAEIDAYTIWLKNPVPLTSVEQAVLDAYRARGGGWPIYWTFSDRTPGKKYRPKTRRRRMARQLRKAILCRRRARK